MTKANALFIVNKVLPDNDYRLDYGRRSKLLKVIYGLPERSRGLADAEYLPLGFREGLEPAVIKALYDLYRYLRRSRSRLAFVHFYTTNPILLGPFVARLAGVPCVVTVTGFGRVMTSTRRRYRLLQPLYRLLFRHSLKTARLALFQNHADLQAAARDHPDLAHKFRYAGSTTAMPLVEQKDFNSPVLTVLLATRLMPDKGVEDFLEVARRLRDGPFEFLLAGPESVGFSDLYQEVLAAGREGVIRFPGELDTPEMERALMGAHILFFPSYGEGMARLMLEAGFAKLCPLAYNISPNRDLVSDGRGFLVETGDLQQIIQLLLSLAADRELLSAHAAAYQRHVASYFGPEKFAERLDAAFREILAPPDSSGK